MSIKDITPGEMLRRAQAGKPIVLPRAQADKKWDKFAQILGKEIGIENISFAHESDLDVFILESSKGYVLNANHFAENLEDLWAWDVDALESLGTMMSQIFIHQAKKSQTQATLSGEVKVIIDAYKKDVLLKQYFQHSLLKLLNRWSNIRTRSGYIEWYLCLLWAGEAGLIEKKKVQPFKRITKKYLPEYEKISLNWDNPDITSIVDAQSGVSHPDLLAKVRLARVDLFKGLNFLAAPPKRFETKYQNAVEKFFNLDEPTSTKQKGIPSVHKVMLKTEGSYIGAGVEQSTLGTCARGKEWVVKGMNDPNLCLVEALCGLLAQYLGILSPRVGVLKTRTGRHAFGSRFVDNVMPINNQDKSSDDYAKLLIFDQLISNSDRHDGNVVVSQIAGQRRVWAIDHGHCLDSLRHRRGTSFAANPLNIKHHAKNLSLKERRSIYKQLNNLSGTHVRNMIKQLPKEWTQSLDQGAIISFSQELEKRSKKIAAEIKAI